MTRRPLHLFALTSVTGIALMERAEKGQEVRFHCVSNRVFILRRERFPASSGRMVVAYFARNLDTGHEQQFSRVSDLREFLRLA